MPHRLQFSEIDPPPIFRGVGGAFAEPDDFLAASDLAHEAQIAFEAFLPVSDEAILRRLRGRSPKSGVRFWTLFGAIGGGIAAMALTIWCSRNWPLVVGGKPIVSWPPFIQPMFEWTVLLGSFLCMTGFFILSGLPNLTLHPAYRPEFAVDQFGLFLPCSLGEEAFARALLARCKAAKIFPILDRGLSRPESPAGAASKGPAKGEP